MFGKILSSTVNIFAYMFRVYSFLYVIKYVIVNDCFCHLCGVILTLKNSGCDNNKKKSGTLKIFPDHDIMKSQRARQADVRMYEVHLWNKPRQNMKSRLTFSTTIM